MTHRTDVSVGLGRFAEYIYRLTKTQRYKKPIKLMI